MAGSLVQVPTVAAASTLTEGGRSGNSTLRKWHRFRMVVGFLHVVGRLVVVSERSPILASPQNQGIYTRLTIVLWYVAMVLWQRTEIAAKSAADVRTHFSLRCDLLHLGSPPPPLDWCLE